MGRATFHQTRLLKSTSNLALNTAREGAATASLGNQGQGLTALRAENFFVKADLNLPFFSSKPCEGAWEGLQQLAGKRLNMG